MTSPTPHSPGREAVTYAELAKFLGPEGANLLSHTVWKDGIDIEVPIDGIQQLVDFKVSALLAAKQEELDKMREALVEAEEIIFAEFSSVPQIIKDALALGPIQGA